MFYARPAFRYSNVPKQLCVLAKLKWNMPCQQQVRHTISDAPDLLWR